MAIYATKTPLCFVKQHIFFVKQFHNTSIRTFSVYRSISFYP